MGIKLKIAGLLSSMLVLLGCGHSTKILKPQSQLKNGVSLYDLTIPSLTGGDTIYFSRFKGKKLLVVNVASQCGYTYQYEGLQQLYEANKGEIEIIGLPCNQFLLQEPGSDSVIASFCEENFGVTFPMTTKINVKGSDQHEVYQWLTRKNLNGVGDFEVKWNFNKFLISEDGTLIAYFPSDTKPMSEELLSHLEK